MITTNIPASQAITAISSNTSLAANTIANAFSNISSTPRPLMIGNLDVEKELIELRQFKEAINILLIQKGIISEAEIQHTVDALFVTEKLAEE